MYSAPAVERVLNPDEVVNQRRYGVLPLNYGAEYQVASVGLEPTTRGLKIMYSNRQSVMYQWRRRLVRVTRSQVSAASRKQSEAKAVGIEPCTPIRQSPLYPNAQRRVAKSVVYYGRPYRRPSRRLLTGPFVSERFQRHSLAGRPASLP